MHVAESPTNCGVVPVLTFSGEDASGSRLPLLAMQQGGRRERSQLMGSLPPMPWHLQAHDLVLITLHWIEVERIRAFLPAELQVVSFLPGKTIGGLFLAKYGRGSDLQYNELIVGAATVWHRGRPCAWVTHLFVDSGESVEGGRTLLGAPKHLVPFTRAEGSPHPITVGEVDRPICRMSTGRQLWLWRQRVRLIAMHWDVRDRACSTLVVHGNELRGRWGITRTRMEIPETSPVRELGLAKPFLCLCGKNVEAILGGASFLPLHTRSVAAPA